MTRPDEGVPGHAAPMEWTLVKDPSEQRGMTTDEIERFLDRPIDGVGSSARDRSREEANG